MTKNEKGWCTDDLDFDNVGQLYIKNPVLAKKIQSVYNAMKKKLFIIRDPFPGERTAEGGPIGGGTVNTMCPCDGP